MKKVSKVMMFVYKEGAPDLFFVVHRKADGTPGRTDDFVVPTGHVEEGEELAAAAQREAEEEFGVKPLHVEKLPYTCEAILQNKTKHSTEYAYLIEIPNVPVEFSERGESGEWHLLAELPDLLTYASQKGAIDFLTEK